MEVQKTALYNYHKNLGAKFVPFAGYEMPIQYKDGIVKEHISTRTHAGFFDVSHMGQFFLEGDETLIESLEKIDDKYWSMESNAEHSLFNFYQKSIFYIENDQIYLVEMQRNLRAFGGLRKEKQEYKINQETKEVEYVFNKKTGKFNFDEFLHGNLTLQLQLKFDLDTNYFS